MLERTFLCLQYAESEGDLRLLIVYNDASYMLGKGKDLMIQLRIPATFTAVFLEVPEGYIGFVEELPGANTQGETLEEARANLQEAVLLVLEAELATR